MPLVYVIMGSESDATYMQGTVDVLALLGISHERLVISAHRTPEKVRQVAQGASDKGVKVIIAGAGAAAHLPGVIASWTTLPVIGVPLPTSDLRGVDSLLAIVQMPSGVPVATVGIGTAGAKNAGYLAAEILAIGDAEIRNAIGVHRGKLAEG